MLFIVADRSEAGMLKDAIGIDLNLLLEEIRQLRIQLVRTIENNNSLRAKLEEQLARSPRQTAASSNINIHHLYAAPAGKISVHFIGYWQCNRNM